MFRTAAAIILTVSMTSSVTATTVSVMRNDTPYSREKILEAVQIFREACQPLGGGQWNDLEKVEVEAMSEFAGHRLAKGWKYTVFIRAKVPDRPSLIPATKSDIGVIAGHTLHYALGGGQAPGFFSTKRASNYLCGVRNYDTSSDIFVPVPGLIMLQ